jgi:CBS domain-containing protein
MSLFVSEDGARFEPYFNEAGPLPSEKIRRVPRVTDPHRIESSPAEARPPDQQANLSKVAAYQQELEQQQKEKKHAFLAGDLMTADPITIAPDQMLSEIQKLFADEGFRHLPVVDETGNLIGIVSDRDVLTFSRLSEEHAEGLPIRHLMTRRAFAATPDTTIHEIARLMLTAKISSLPILDSAHNLIGIVTTTDILRGLLKRVPVELWV